MTRHLLKIETGESVNAARAAFKKGHVRHLVVVKAGALAGLLAIDDLDLVDQIRSRFSGNERESMKITVGDLMSRHPVTIREDSTMIQAIRIMNQKNVHAMPVTGDNGQLRGIITTTDVMRYALVASQTNEAEETYRDFVEGG